MQPHNLTRPARRFEGWGDAEICALADRACTGGAGASLERDEIDLLLRATLVAPPGHELVVCDFAGVEARGLAWCADDRAALDVFEAGDVDPYIVAASTIYGVSYDAVSKTQRTIGKIAELACGYQGGVAAFERFASTYGIDLSDVDVPAVVRAWRAAHAPTVRFWYALQDSFARACEGRGSWVSCFEFVPSDDGRDVAVFLPSGRPIVYPEARAAWRHVDGRRRSALSYRGAFRREHVYGGLLAENVIQALCRDLLADAMVRADRAGLRIALHVHDEIVCEEKSRAAKEALAELQRTMLSLPEWAHGFPIGAAGYTGKRYRK
jgi:DNA polymerase